MRHDVHVLPRPGEGDVRLGQLDLDMRRVDHLEVLDQVKAAAAADGDRRVDHRLVGELDVLGGERLAIGPFHIGAQLDLPHQPVGRDATVLPRRHLGRQVGIEVAALITAPERVEHADFRDVLGAGIDPEQRVELHGLLGHAQDHPFAVDCLGVAGSQPRRQDQRGGERAGNDAAAGNSETLGQSHRSLLCGVDWCFVVQVSIRNRGSSASRRPSPRKLKPMTVSVIIAPGRMASHGTVSK